jgi:hypothetical protein
MQSSSNGFAFINKLICTLKTPFENAMKNRKTTKNVITYRNNLN